MLNYQLPDIPDRPEKPRDYGITMMMDKGLSLIEVESIISSSSDLIDVVKFGFGTSLITKNLEKKIELYKEAGLKPYFGGTLFEVFVYRNMFDDYRKFIEKYKLELVEVSDGSYAMPHDEKLKYIEILTKDVTVLSEVGSKMKDVIIPTDKWVNMMKSELEAGSWKVIGEARESGNIGLYNADGSANTDLIDGIINELKPEDIIWEAPNKPQQVWFIKMFGANVNLGNIASNEIIPLETLRLGVRGDTFFQFLNQ
ncbi:phosphosulfolactate synthase [Bacteroidota bacterium]